jgi:hypothetical protein
MKNKAWIFVNSFSFNFLEFLAKIYWANFFPWSKEAKKGGAQKPDWPGPRDRVGRSTQSDRPGGSRRQSIPVFARIAPFRLPSSVKKF